MQSLRDARTWAGRHPDATELGLGAATMVLVLGVSLVQWGLTDAGWARGVGLGVPLGVVTAWVYRRRRVREEHRERALRARRLQLARELHDTVAGQVAVIGIQAAAARRVLEARPADAALALERIEAASRAAVGDLRRMLEALRDETAPTTRTADPGLAELPDLLAGARAAGVQVSLVQDGEPSTTLPIAVDRAAYRIVQEALTNVARHAGPVPTIVRIGYSTGEVRIRVANEAGRHPAGQPGTGIGLPSMRDRVALFGGSLAAGPDPGGGWMVDARLPWAAGA